jgi:hypothetical protein
MAVRYETFGPFGLERDGNKFREEALLKMWSGVESSNKELPGAVGVYILAISAKRGSALKPWYVGRTDKQCFRDRFKQQLGKFGNVLDLAKNGKPQVFLIARITSSGNFTKPSKTKLPYNDKVESLLIDSCLTQNSELINAKKVKHLGLVVPGYRNSDRGKPTKAAKELRRMLTCK